MQHNVHTFTSSLAIFERAYVPFNEAEICPSFANQVADLVEIALVTGSEVIKSGDPLVQLEQGFNQIGTDEAGRAREEPMVTVLT